jgi:putative FmdB family regulatory protein
MPLFDFTCQQCGCTTEFLIQSFKEAEQTEEVMCPDCGGRALKQIGVPFPAHFYGNPDGYYKPSPTKRHSYKLADKDKGNKHSGG